MNLFKAIQNNNHKTGMLKSNSRFVILIFVSLLIYSGVSLAENRTYLLEVYDHIDKRKFEIVTEFSPDKYLSTHGGGRRSSVIIKATWMCYGDTSGLIRPCKMPKPRNPIYKKGETVKVTLNKHISQGWEGIVELSLYRRDLKGNVYGVRFLSKKQMYGRYFEKDITKVTIKKPEPVKTNK